MTDEYYSKAEILYTRFQLCCNKAKLARFVLNTSRPYIKELRLWLQEEHCHSHTSHENSLNKALLMIEEVAEGRYTASEISRKLAREAAWGMYCLEVPEEYLQGMRRCKSRSQAIANIIIHTLETIWEFNGPNNYKYKIIHLIHDVSHSWKEIVDNIGEIMYETAT